MRTKRRHKSANHITEQTQAHLIDLLAHRPYSKISFTELAEAVGVSRQGLYHYYGSKDDILALIIEDLLDEIYLETTQNTARLNSDSVQELCLRVADILLENKTTMRTIFTSELNEVLIQKLTSFLKRVFGLHIRRNCLTLRHWEEIDYLALMLAGALFHSLKKWVHDDFIWPKENLIAMLYPLLSHSIESIETQATGRLPRPANFRQQRSNILRSV